MTTKLPAMPASSRHPWPLPALVAILLIGCVAPAPTPQDVVDAAIAWQGGQALNRAELTFDFRGRQFRVYRNAGLFEYERRYVDSTGATIREVLSNDGLTREVNGLVTPMDSALYASMETSVNSVVYFALLPLPLNDPAAQKRLLGVSEIEGKTYHELEVTFVPEGGGRDYDDRFIYWIDVESGALDYLAYYFHVDGGGSRFRKAVNVRSLQGVRLADYLNYAADGIDLPIDQVEDYDSLHVAGQTRLVSEILLENLTLRLLPTEED